jgi:hypothetical protein
MARLAPFFVTGASCKIKVNGVTLAYATNFSYSVSIPHARPKNLGSYESSSLDPLSYDVSGSFDVVRYVDGLKGKMAALGYSVPDGVSDLGNGIGSWSSSAGKAPSIKNISSNDGRANESLDPSRLQDAITFDIEIYQKLPDGNLTGIARVRNARITAMGASLTKRGTMIQSFQFAAQYLDEDSFIADASSSGA